MESAESTKNVKASNPSPLWGACCIAFCVIFSLVAFTALSPYLLPYSVNRNVVLQHDGFVNAHSADGYIQHRIVINEIIDREISLVESRLRDHFGLLITLSGLAVTFILGIFSFSMAKSEDRYIKEIKERLLDASNNIKNVKNECEKVLEAARKECNSIQDLHVIAEKKVNDFPSLDVKLKEGIQDIKKNDIRDVYTDIYDSDEAQTSFLAAGIKYYSEGEYDSACFFFNTYLDYDNNKDNIKVLFMLAYSIHQIARNKKQRDDKVKLLKKAQSKYIEVINKDKDEFYSWNNLGLVFELLADEERDSAKKDNILQEAEKCYDKSLQIKPCDGETYSNLTILFYHRAKDEAKSEEDRKYYAEKSEQALEQAERWGIPDPYNAACLYGVLGKEEKCKEYLEKALEEKCLPNRQMLENENDLVSMKDKSWFQSILAGAPEKTTPSIRQV